MDAQRGGAGALTAPLLGQNLATDPPSPSLDLHTPRRKISQPWEVTWSTQSHPASGRRTLEPSASMPDCVLSTAGPDPIRLIQMPEAHCRARLRDTTHVAFSMAVTFCKVPTRLELAV